MKTDTIVQIQQTREERVLHSNEHRTPTRTPSQCLGVRADEIISFEHININGISSHDSFIELSNTMGILEQMEAGVYNVVETQWDTTCPKFCKMIQETMKQKDKYVKATFSSNMDDSYLTSWKAGGTLVDASGRWASRVVCSGSDPLGCWSWLDMRDKQGHLIRVISAYKVSQDSPAQAGETTSCKQ